MGGQDPPVCSIDTQRLSKRGVLPCLGSRNPRGNDILGRAAVHNHVGAAVAGYSCSRPICSPVSKRRERAPRANTSQRIHEPFLGAGYLGSHGVTPTAMFGGIIGNLAVMRRCDVLQEWVMEQHRSTIGVMELVGHGQPFLELHKTHTRWPRVTQSLRKGACEAPGSACHGATNTQRKTGEPFP